MFQPARVSKANENVIDGNIEDHTQFELFVADAENEVELVEDNDKDDTDLDFDFTDDEKGDDESSKEEVKETTEKVRESPEHTEVVNLLLNPSVSGIESEIDCCLIDKKTFMTKAGAVSEEVTLVLKDQFDPPIIEQTHLKEEYVKKAEPKQNAHLNTAKQNSLHGSEYMVCELCKIIYHRPLGSNTNKCLMCIKRGKHKDEGNFESVRKIHGTRNGRSS